MTIVFASDHAGYEMRETLASKARELGHETVSVGAPSSEPYDYPDAADEAVGLLLDGRAQFGVFVCGTGLGISMRANRHSGVRAAPCCSIETARLAREHNDANVLGLGARTTPIELAEQMMQAFLSEPASQVERHRIRVQKLDGNV